MVLDSGRYQISLLHQPVEADFCNQETKQQPQRYRKISAVSKEPPEECLTKDQLLHLLLVAPSALIFPYS